VDDLTNLIAELYQIQLDFISVYSEEREVLFREMLQRCLRPLIWDLGGNKIQKLQAMKALKMLCTFEQTKSWVYKEEERTESPSQSYSSSEVRDISMIIITYVHQSYSFISSSLLTGDEWRITNACYIGKL
jgi:hypothetical protein